MWFILQKQDKDGMERLKVTWKMVRLIKDYAVKDKDTELGAAAMNKWIGTT